MHVMTMTAKPPHQKTTLVYHRLPSSPKRKLERTAAVGDYCAERLHGLAQQFPHLIASIEGSRHRAGIYFTDLEPDKAFAAHPQDAGLDIRVQAYKEGHPPSALTKLPLIAGCEAVDHIIGHMESALRNT